MSALDNFRALTPPEQADAFRIGEELCPGCRLAVSHDGHVALLLDVAPTGKSTPRHFENLRYEPPRALEVLGKGANRRVEQRATLVCRTKEEGLQEAFLRISVAMFDSREARLTESELELRLDELVSLFRALGRPANQTIQGLWCELAIVLWSAEPATALASWHSSPRALHDFASGADRLEVKSCSTGMREHALRLEQLQEAPGGRTVLASIVIDDEDEGETVPELCEAILGRVGHDVELKRRLEAIVTQSLGRDWRDAAAKRFSLEKARRGLRFYEVKSVPTVPMPIPTEVKHVSFVVDLSNTPYIPTDALPTNGFFSQILPR